MPSRKPDAARSPLRSDLARTQIKLDALPDRAVIIDAYGDAWQKSGYVGDWYRAFDGEGRDSFAVAQQVTPMRVVSKGSTEAEVDRRIGYSREDRDE